MIRLSCLLAFPSYFCTGAMLLACASSSSSNASKQPEVVASSNAPVAMPAPAPDGTAAKTESEAQFASIPTTCGEGQADGVCAPPKPFVKWMCGAYPRPDVALGVFRKGTPFTRAYLNRNVEAWYTSGQQSTSAKLLFDEEVIVLSHPKASATGMVVGQGGAPYDVLRIDGVCSSVEAELVSLKRPPTPKHANIQWQQLDKGVREALAHDPNIAKAEAARRKECKGTTTLGVIGAACAKADDRLSAAIAGYVVEGGASPMPTSP